MNRENWITIAREMAEFREGKEKSMND